MRRYRGMLALSCIGVMCWATGCVSQTEHDATLRANLQMQDKLGSSRAERVKARTRVAMLRQEILQARQAQQAAQDKIDSMGRQIDALHGQLDVQAEAINRMQKGAPQTQVTVSLSPDTLNKIIRRVQDLTEEVSRLRSQNNKLQYDLKIRAAAKEVAVLTAETAKLKGGPAGETAHAFSAASSAPQVTENHPPATQATR